MALEMKIRKAERRCICRICNGTIQRGETIFHNWSYVNRGTTTIFCSDCMNKVYSLIWTYKVNNPDEKQDLTRD